MHKKAYTITVELARTADREHSLASVLFVRAELSGCALGWQRLRAVVAEGEVVASASFQVAQAGGIAEGDRVAVCLELISADFEALVTKRAGSAKRSVAGVGMERP